MEYSIADIYDRFSILNLKLERLPDSGMEKEYQVYKHEFDTIRIKCKNILEHLNFLYSVIYYVNRQIWDLEADIRSENEELLGLEEVGRRAIKIREWNNQRIRIKNLINLVTSTGFNERKSTW